MITVGTAKNSVAAPLFKNKQNNESRTQTRNK